jgi:hypothetical protein
MSRGKVKTDDVCVIVVLEKLLVNAEKIFITTENIGK